MRLFTTYLILVLLSLHAGDLEDLTKKAKQGDAKAQHDLGLLYVEGKGIKKDLKLAFEWLSKSAEQGLSEAQCTFGYMYEIGEGIKQDSKLAVKWYILAAEQGNGVAQNYL